jgi:hypothetical protein
MSESTFSIRPLTEAEIAQHEAHIKKMCLKSHSCNPCWLCGAKISIRKYADHAEKHRREGWKPRPHAMPKLNSMQVFAEWQQADVTDADSIAWD